MKGKNAALPPWDELLSAAARLQGLVPGTVLVGGTAAALIADHRFSYDADHVMTDLRSRFDAVRDDLERAAGWKTARSSRPVIILGSLDGIETGIRQLKRSEPLETQTIASGGLGTPDVTIPTPAELLRVKAWLALTRNATRDYIDAAALSDHLGPRVSGEAFRRFDQLYPQDEGQSATQQLLVQLGRPRPYDLDGTDLSHYKGLTQRWHEWEAVSGQLGTLAASIMQMQIEGPNQPSGRGRIAKGVRSSSDVTDQEIEALTRDITDIGPGTTQGRIRFDWNFLDQKEKDERLRSLDRHPDRFKARLLRLWRERDPKAVQDWEARGQQPQSKDQSKKGNSQGR